MSRKKIINDLPLFPVYVWRGLFFLLLLWILINHLCKNFNMKWWNNFHTLASLTRSHQYFMVVAPNAVSHTYALRFVMLLIHSIRKLFKLILSLFKFKYVEIYISNEMSSFGSVCVCVWALFFSSFVLRLHNNNEIFRFTKHK